jgi:hypothetical protein
MGEKKKNRNFYAKNPKEKRREGYDMRKKEWAHAGCEKEGQMSCFRLQHF